MKKLAIVAMLIAAVITAACAWNKPGSLTTAKPTPTASPSPRLTYVTDSQNVFDPSARSQLEATLATFKEREKIDFSVLVVDSSGNQSAGDYSFALARERNRHVHDSQGGIFLLVALNDRKWHVQVTRNLESKLTPEVLTTLSQPMA